MHKLTRLIALLLPALALGLVLASPALGRKEIRCTLVHGDETVEFTLTRRLLHVFWLPLAMDPGRAERAYALGPGETRVQAGDRAIPLEEARAEPPPGTTAGTLERIAGLVAIQRQMEDGQAVPAATLPDDYTLTETTQTTSPAFWPAYLAAAVCLALSMFLGRPRAAARPSSAADLSLKEWLAGLRAALRAAWVEWRLGSRTGSGRTKSKAKGHTPFSPGRASSWSLRDHIREAALRLRTRSSGGSSLRQIGSGATETLKDLGGQIGDKVRLDAIKRKSGETIGHGLRFVVRKILRR